MTDETPPDADTPSGAVTDEAPAPVGRSRASRHLLVLLIACIGLLVGGVLVVSGRSSSDTRPSSTTVPTTEPGALLPSLGVVPDLETAKALLTRLDPKTLRPAPTPSSSAASPTSIDSPANPPTTSTSPSANPGAEATEAGVRRCEVAIQQQTTDRSLGDRLAAARLQVATTTDLVVSYSLPASGKSPAASRVLLVDARSCRVLAAVQH